MYNLKLRMKLSPSNRPRPLHAPVLEVLDLVYPHNPVFSGVGLLQHIQLKVLENRKYIILTTASSFKITLLPISALRTLS